MRFGKALTHLSLVAALVVAIASLAAVALVRATEGVITHVDSTAKTVTLKTADGTEEVFKFTGSTAVRGARGVKAGAVDAYFAGKEGTHVIVRYTEEGSEKAAVGIDDFGKDSMKVARGVVSGSDKTAHTVTVKTEDGSEETYHLAKNAAVDSEHGIVRGTEYIAKNGEKVTVHYTEEAGHKVAHLIKHI